MEGAGEFMERIVDEPLLLWTAAVLSIFLVVGIVKRVLSIIVSCAVLLILYLVYLTFLEEQFPIPEMDWSEWRGSAETWFGQESEPSSDENDTEPE